MIRGRGVSLLCEGNGEWTRPLCLKSDYADGFSQAAVFKILGCHQYCAVNHRLSLLCMLIMFTAYQHHP